MLTFFCSSLLVLAAILSCQAQSTRNEAGPRLSFEVASIRPANPNARETTNLDLDPSDYFRYTGGPITASGALINYIIFAYKIQDRSEADLIYSHLPAWTKQPYTLRATTESGPTKDQLRVMVQSLLAERFQLKLHTENHELPVYALVVDHSPAPGLAPEPDDALCARPFDRPKSLPTSSVQTQSCGLIITDKGTLREARMGDYTLDEIAGNLTLASHGALDPRPIINKTGLRGHYDLDIEFLPPKRQTDAPTSELSAEEPGATFEEALKRQAGLKLIKQIGPIPVYIIDHIEPPTEN